MHFSVRETGSAMALITAITDVQAWQDKDHTVELHMWSSNTCELKLHGIKIIKVWPNSEKSSVPQHGLWARTQRNLITSLVHNFNSRKEGENLIMGDAVRPWSNTTSDHTNGSFASRHAPLGSFYGEYHVTVSVAIKAEREGERGVRLPAKWSREMRIPSGWQTPGRLFEKVSFALIWLCWGWGVFIFFQSNNMTFY